MPRDFSAKQIRVSQLIASGGTGTNAGLLIYSASDGTNYTGGFPAALTAGIGPDVFMFVSGTEDGKAKGTGVTLFGGDVVISGTMYAERTIIEVDITSTGSAAISGSLFVSQSATINEGLTVNNTGESGPENDFTVKGSSNTTLLFGDVSTNRVGIGVTDPDSTLEVFSTSTQLKLSNNAADYATLAVGSNGDLTVTTVDAAAGSANFTVVADGAVDIDANQGALSLDGSAGINIGTETDVAIDIDASTLDIDTSGAITIDTPSTFSVDSVGATNLTSHGVLTLSGSDGLNVASDEGEIDLTSRQGAIDVNAGAALSLDGASGINIGTAANVAVDLNASTLNIDATGILSLDSADTTNITMAANDGGNKYLTVKAANTGGGHGTLNLTGSIVTINASSAINLGADMDVAFNIDTSTLDIDSSGAITIDGTSTFSIDGIGASNVTTVGVLTLSGSTQTLVKSEAEADTAVKIHAAGTAGGIDVDSGTGGYQNTSTGRLHLTSSMNTGDGHAIQMLASAGGIQIDATGAAGEDITIKNTGGSINISATETSADAINIDSSGGMDVDVADAISLETTSADGHIEIKTAHTAGVAVHIDADADAGSIVDIDAGILQIDATGVAGINSGGTLSLGTANSGVAVNIGHGTSEVTVGDNITVVGNLGVNGIVSGSMGLSGSLTRLTDGKSFIEAGANITVTSASNGAITITGAGGSAAGSDTQVQYNDGGSSFGAITNLTTDGTNVTLLDAGELRIGTGTDLIISSSSDDVIIGMATNNKDLIFRALDGNTDKEVMRIDGAGASLVMGSNSNTTAKFLIVADSGENLDGIKIQQDDNGERAIWIDSEGAGIYMTAKDGLEINVDEDDGFGINTYRNKGAAATGAPLVRIRDQDGDQVALRVLAESLNPAAFAIGVGNVGGIKTTISGSGQMGLGMGTTAYDATLHVRSHVAGAGIEVEQQGGGDTVVKIYDDTDDGIVDVYANNAVTSRIHGNGLSFIGGDLQVTGSELDVAEYIRHLGDNDTYMQFDDDAIRFNAGGKELANFNETESTIAFNTDNNTINTIIQTDTKLAFAAGTPLGAGKDQVLIMSGGAASSTNEAAANDVLFYVSGSTNSRGTTTRGTSVFGGDVVISGSLSARQQHFTTHKLTPGNSTACFVRFDTNGSDAPSASVNNKMVSPYPGSLLKVMARSTGVAGITVIGLHTNTDTNADLNGTASENITVNMSVADTTYTFAFTIAANYGPGDIVGLKVNPTNDPGTTVITAVWEFESYI